MARNLLSCFSAGPKREFHTVAVQLAGNLMKFFDRHLGRSASMRPVAFDCGKFAQDRVMDVAVVEADVAPILVSMPNKSDQHRSEFSDRVVLACERATARQPVLGCHRNFD